MINNLTFNTDMFYLTYVTNDNMHFDLIKNCVKDIPNSKKKFGFGLEREYLLVEEKYYEKTIDIVADRLNYSDFNDIYWANVNGILFPSGCYQIAVAGIDNMKNISIKTKEDIVKYFNTINDKLNIKSYTIYDNVLGKYCIGLYGDNYQELTNRFNEFVLENGIGPFNKIEKTSRYGKLELVDYPLPNKRLILK